MFLALQNFIRALRIKQWCSKTTKLQDQDHLFFQDQDQSGQDNFFKTKIAFFKDHQIINSRTLAYPEILIEKGSNWKNFCDVILVTFVVT